MYDFEILFFIFIDSFTSNLLFITNSEIAIWAALKLSNIPKEIILSISFLGIIFAGICNYVLGFAVYNIFREKIETGESSSKNYNLILSYFLKFKYYIIIFAFISLYSKFIVFLSGYLRFRPLLFILGTSIVRTLYHGFGN
jgi:membrane protein YqaA with SNARE-associated domain